MKKITCVRYVLLSIAIVTFLQSCKKDNGEPPTLPPENSFVIDFSDFQDNQQKSYLQDEENPTYVNWGTSALGVAFWNVAITITSAVPVASFKEAFNHEAEYQDNGKWLWTYTVSVGLQTYTAKLYGKISGNSVNWEMYISNEGVYEDFLWYTGTSNIFATEGTWSLNKSPQAPEKFIDINWSITDENNAEVTFTNAIPNNEGNGGYIKFGKTTTGDFNRFYNIYVIEQGNLIEINWNYDTKNGRVKNQKFYSDTNWHCWDENLADIICE